MEEKGVQILDRVLDIVEVLALSRDPWGVSDLANKLSLHKSTVHRLLNALLSRGYVEKIAKGPAYRLGLKFIEVASARLNQLELKTEAAPFLRQLAETLGHVVHLATLEGAEVVYIDKVEPVPNLRMYSQIGRRVPCYCTSLGKALLSGLRDDEIDALEPTLEMKAMTPKTVRTFAEVKRAVHQTRAAGWATDDEEHELGIRCLGAPIRDYTGHVMAAVSVSADKKAFPADRDAEFAQFVVQTAAMISKRLGFPEVKVL